MLTRREMLLAAGATVAFRDDSLDLVLRALKHASGEAQDEDFWAQVQAAFTLDRNLVNFNNGGVCPSPRIVNEALRRQIEYSNQAPSYYMWRHLEPEVRNVAARLARHFGCEPDEVAVTRNASEALGIAINGLDLKPGDEILTTDQDYPRMVNMMRQRERREGVRFVQVHAPHRPGDKQELVRAVEQGVTSKTKMILVSQVVFYNGQIWPVKEVCELGRSRNIPVIVDGAHAFAQFPFTQEQLGCDYYGTSLHKWLMAPVGTGMLYVKKDKIKSLWPLMAGTPEQDAAIVKFEEIGTHPAANHNAIGEALTFHEMIGAARKADRLRYLRSRWTDRLRGYSNVVFHTNLAPEHSCGLTTVELAGVSPADLQTYLLDRGVFVTAIETPHYKGIRVTPNVYTTLSEVDLFADLMLRAAREGIG
jgi:selenocysteine lyase/cysteine desulfurase